MRSPLRRFGAALAVILLVLSARPVPAPAQQQQPEVRLLFCAVTCLYHALSGQCSGRNNEQCVAWYSGCLEGCMFAI
jgi:hypothetical protein